MAKWRTILDEETDEEVQVAPVCPQPDIHAMMFGGHPEDSDWFKECCVGPRLSCRSEDNAKFVASMLGSCDAAEIPS